MARKWAASKGYKLCRPSHGEIAVYEQGSAEAFELAQTFSKLLYIAELWNGDGAVTGMMFTVNYNVKDNRLYVGQWSDRHVTPIYFRTYDLAEKSMEMHAALWRQFYRR